MSHAPHIRLLIVDDHPIVRDGLKSVLYTVPQLKLVALCASGSEALSEVASQPVDLILADVRMTPMSGIELLRRLKLVGATVRTLLFSSYDREEEIYQGFVEGAAGYLHKDAPSEELVRGILAAAAGERVFSKKDLMICEERSKKKGLTVRELEILELVAKGLTNKEIGEVLCISPLTARNLIKRIYQKLDASDRSEATRIAIERGFITLD